MRWNRTLLGARVSVILLFTSVARTENVSKTLCAHPAPGKYIIELNANVNLKAFIQQTHIKPIYEYTLDNSFYVNAQIREITALCTVHKASIKSIEKDQQFKLQSFVSVQDPAPWNLERLNSALKVTGNDPTLQKYKYRYDENGGKDVDIYIIDSGVLVEHQEFGGRAVRGPIFVSSGLPPTKLYEHATHCASIAAGRRFGVAKAAKIISLQVVSQNPKTGIQAATGADISQAVQYVIQQHRPGRRKSIINMSLTMPAVSSSAPVIERMINKAIKAGIHVVVAAGNDNTDAKKLSPARMTNVITVGATNFTDTRSQFSNYGPSVDLFAPGENIWGASMNSNDAASQHSGTSTAAPHVAGIVAVLLSRYGQVPPATMAETLKRLALKHMIALKLPDGEKSTANLLAHISDKPPSPIRKTGGKLKRS